VLASGTSTVSIAAGASSFTFTDSQSGAYRVSVLSQPDGQTCTVRDGSGSATGSAISSVRVVCRGYTAYVAHAGDGALRSFRVGTGGLLSALGSTATAIASPSALVADPGGRAVWVAHLDSAALNSWLLADDGSLASSSALAGSSNSYGLALSADRSVLYAADYGNASVTTLGVLDSGALTGLSGGTVAAGSNPQAVAASPTGSFVFAANASGQSVSIYRSSAGLLSLVQQVSVADQGSTPVALAVSPTGLHLFVLFSTSAKLVSYGIDASSGALTLVGSHAYVANRGSATISQFSVSSGRLTALATPTVSTGNLPASLGLSPDGRYLYATASGDDTVWQYQVSATGQLSALATSSIASGGRLPTAIAVR
jgi:6-phosphogluconolactonase (cycloisomerase 2 family)